MLSPPVLNLTTSSLLEASSTDANGSGTNALHTNILAPAANLSLSHDNNAISGDIIANSIPVRTDTEPQKTDNVDISSIPTVIISGDVAPVQNQTGTGNKTIAPPKLIAQDLSHGYQQQPIQTYKQHLHQSDLDDVTANTNNDDGDDDDDEEGKLPVHISSIPSGPTVSYIVPVVTNW